MNKPYPAPERDALHPNESQVTPEGATESTAATAPDAGPLREGIAYTRAEIAATIGALETRLSPSELKEKLGVEAARIETKMREAAREVLVEARTLVKEELAEASGLLRREVVLAEGKIRTGLADARDIVKDDLQKAITHAKQSARAATLGKVEDLATSLGDVMNETRDTLLETIRHNPIPAALAGVGLAWLLMNRSSSAERRRPQDTRGPEGYGPRTATGSSFRDGARHGSQAVADVAHRASDVVSHAGHRMASTATEALAQAGETVHHAGESAGALLQGAASAAGHVSDHAAHAALHFVQGASDAASGALESARSQARRVERGFDSMLRERPLAVGAAVVIAGAALGYALPRTRQEDALMGQSRDRFIQGAEAAIHDAASAVGHVTALTADATKDALEGAAARP
jgi:hypothetical protein